MSNQLSTNSYASLLLSKDNKDVVKYFEDSYVENQFKYFMAQKVPVSDIVKYFHKAQVSGADPLMEQIYLIPRNVKVKKNGRDEYETVGTIVFSYHFIEVKAQASKEYQGYSEKIGQGMYFDPETNKEVPMLCATIIVKRSGFEYPYTAWYREYVKTSSYGVTSAWKKPMVMLRKCAMAGALRSEFPEWLSGSYTREEMGAIEKDDDSIEAEFNRQEAAEKTIQIQENIEKKIEKTENMDEVNSLCLAIQDCMSFLMKGLSVADKGKAMSDLLGVKKFDDIKTKSLDELRLRDSELRVLIKEKADREIAATKTKTTPSNNKPTFKLEGY